MNEGNQFTVFLSETARVANKGINPTFQCGEFSWRTDDGELTIRRHNDEDPTYLLWALFPMGAWLFVAISGGEHD